MTQDPRELDRLFAALKGNRHDHRDYMVALVTFLHGLGGELVDLRWDDINWRRGTIAIRRLKGSIDGTHYLERDEAIAAVWSIPAQKMKMRRPHRIPLASRSVEVLRDLHAVTGNGRFVFPSNRSRQRCMSENTINAALRRLGFAKEEMTAHGFRSAASSILNECGLLAHPMLSNVS